MKIRLRNRSTVHSISHIADHKLKTHPSKMLMRTNNLDYENDDILNRLYFGVWSNYYSD